MLGWSRDAVRVGDAWEGHQERKPTAGTSQEEAMGHLDFPQCPGTRVEMVSLPAPGSPGAGALGVRRHKSGNLGWDQEALNEGVADLPGLLLLLCLTTVLADHRAPLWGKPHTTPTTTRCYSAAELPLGLPPRHLLARGAKWEQSLPVTLVSSLEVAARRRRRYRSPARTQCPELQLEQVLEADIPQRSISPWRYRIDTDENRYPQKLAFAECLCRGCISTRTGRETTALNSVQLHQNLLVLRRRPCAPDGADGPQPGASAFHAEFISVPVGCTCVVPRSTR
ncbi:interleukin-17C [Rhynchocyon petersi]